jgi:MFS transporter, putative metabolite:H+ symporter
VKRFRASPIEAIRYALVFFVLQDVFAFLGTALADWIGRRPSAILAAVIEVAATILAATSDSLAEYQVFGAVAIATLGWLWGVGDTYISELFPTVLRGTGFGIAVGGGRIVSIAAPTVIGWGHYPIRAGDTVPRAGRAVGADASRLPARTRDERQRAPRPS